jgi:VWFA-related protein
MRAGFVPALALSSAFNLQFAASQATTPATDQNPVIRSRAGEVLLDLVVRDKHHHLVNDLTPADVEVYEDGVRQDIKHFQLAEGAEELQAERKDVQAKTIEKGSQSASPVPQETLKQLNFVSIVFAPTAPLNREFAREAVLDFLKSDTLPNTYVTIYSMGNTLQLVQPYTADKDTLMAAVNKVSKGISSKTDSDASTSVASSAISTTLGNAPVPGPAAGSITDPMLQEFSGAIGTVLLGREIPLHTMLQLRLAPHWRRRLC